MSAVLGVLAYVLICAFSPVQFLAMLRKKNINFGAWPLASLTLGLALLSLSFFWVTVPMYVMVGQAISLTFTLLLLMRVALFKPKTERFGNTLETYAEKTLRDTIFDTPAFLTILKGRNKPAVPKAYQSDKIQMASLDFSSPPLPAPSFADFAQCSTCTALVFVKTAHVVELCAYDVFDSIKRYNIPELRETPQTREPYENSVHTLAHIYYCRRDKKAYDRMVVVPSAYVGGETSIEYYKRNVAVHNPGWDDVREIVTYAQVTEDGEQYD